MAADPVANVWLNPPPMGLSRVRWKVVARAAWDQIGPASFTRSGLVECDASGIWPTCWLTRKPIPLPHALALQLENREAQEWPHSKSFLAAQSAESNVDGRMGRKDQPGVVFALTSCFGCVDPAGAGRSVCHRQHHSPESSFRSAMDRVCLPLDPGPRGVTCVSRCFYQARCRSAIAGLLAVSAAAASRWIAAEFAAC